jgi:periplasmic protein CpxP/Spy
VRSVIRRLGLALTVVAVPAVLTSAPLHAQRIERVPPRPGAGGNERAGLERQFRERLAEVVKRRLDLNDSQMQQLKQVNEKFEGQRMLLNRDERRVRQELRAQVLAGDTANQSRVGELLDQALRIQRQRLDLTENEQKELSKFMTPTQRAKYFGIQDELRRRMEEIRQQRQGRRGEGASVGPRRLPP